MHFPIDWQDEARIRHVFNWLTRIGAGVKFGSRPIGWYQIHQCHALDVIHELTGDVPVRCRDGMIQAKKNKRWSNVLTPDDVFREADKRVVRDRGDASRIRAEVERVDRALRLASLRSRVAWED